MKKTLAPGETGPTLRPLTPEEREAREIGLDYAARIAQSERPLSDERLQYMYDGFLNEKLENEKAIIALGLSFGESITLHMDMEWVRITDDAGEETGLAVPGLVVFCFPISMIQKRLGRSEPVDIAQLRQGTIEALREHVSKPNNQTR